MHSMESLVLSGNATSEVSADATIRVEDNAEAAIMLAPQEATKVRLDIGRGCKVSCTLLAGGRAELELSSAVGEGSSLRCVSLWLGGGKGAFSSTLAGRGASANDLHLFVGGGDSSLSIESTLVHGAGPTSGDILVRGIVMGRSSADLGGMIKITKDGAGAESFLSEHVLMLGEGARASAQPRLEIENNDVSSRHAASVSRIDGGKRFYLMSRGLPEHEAERLIAEGFLLSAMERIGNERLREIVQSRALARLGPGQ
jgi:Fe-S cluster assembly scaffold protein SufB